VAHPVAHPVPELGHRSPGSRLPVPDSLATSSPTARPGQSSPANSSPIPSGGSICTGSRNSWTRRTASSSRRSRFL
jgi:hypothetical protein